MQPAGFPPAFVTNPPEDRSAVAVAWAWASRIITICLGMVLPGLLGYWLDQKLGTKVLFTLLGFAVGMAIGIWQLMRMVAANSSNNPPDQQK